MYSVLRLTDRSQPTGRKIKEYCEVMHRHTVVRHMFSIFHIRVSLAERVSVQCFFEAGVVTNQKQTIWILILLKLFSVVPFALMRDERSKQCLLSLLQLQLACFHIH